MPVRKLADFAPGEPLEGAVASIELAGAFVDVGAETNGFVHISNIKPKRINRVEEAVKLGEQVAVWVQTVDPAAGRLELTMIRPVELKWSAIEPGMKVSGRVSRIENFGAFVDIGAERDGLVHVSEMSLDYVRDPNSVVSVGDGVEAIVLELDRKKKQIRLSMKAAEISPEPEDEPEEELPTAMELALRQAMEGEPAKAESKPTASEGTEPTELDDLLSRTLSQRIQTSSSESEE